MTFLTIWKLKVSLLSNILKMNLSLSRETTKSRKVAWMQLCSTFNSGFVGYISIKALPNSPQSIKTERSSINWKLL